MRLLTWNIMHGGGARRIPEIALALLEHDADVIAISEFRRAMGGQLSGVLFDHGWRFQASTDPPSQKNGLFFASRFPLTQGTPAPDKSMAQRWLDTVIDDGSRDGLRVTAVHLPDASFGGPPAQAKRSLYWRKLLDSAAELAGTPRIFLGDFNSGRHRLDEQRQTFTCTALLGQLATMGFRDAYRDLHPDGRDWSWFSHAGAGFRIDHAFVSPEISGSIRAAWYSHAERESRLSDHAPMVLDLALGDAPKPAKLESTRKK